ncbi:UNVERIFIED_ORG: hypothetical protein J2X79_000619 [Arthrobacter globiformis]|nr:hypothetical protein [Arthrobacter globiformis]
MVHSPPRFDGSLPVRRCGTSNGQGTVEGAQSRTTRSSVRAS